MTAELTTYSPHIQIYLEHANGRIRLSDVLYQSATLYEKVVLAPKTLASIVFCIDGNEEKEEVILENGISVEDQIIRFRYTDPKRLNGRNYLNDL